MTEQLNPKINPNSFVTLHYKLVASDGTEIVDTFASKPATLQMGSGQLAPTLEDCLLGMEDGQEGTFTLEPGKAFGTRKQDLVKRIPRAELPPNAPTELHSQIDFQAEDGNKFSGLVREADADAVTIDFNHPLAGKHLTFTVRIIGVL